MIESDELKAPGLSHGFFTRAGGHSTGIFASLNCGMGSGDDKSAVRRNRSMVATALKVPEQRLITAYQVHSSHAVFVSDPWEPEDRPKADAIVTTARGLAIGILTADCGPLLFADRSAGVIAAAHAGWKGALTGITASTLDLMEQHGAARRNTVVVLGPTIAQEAYEVGPEFPERFVEAEAGNTRYFEPSRRPRHFMFDLPRYLEDRLKREGAGRVVNLSLCTFADESRFFSYRRATHRGEKDYGRQISAIALA